jgi:hypothetical protein
MVWRSVSVGIDVPASGGGIKQLYNSSSTVVRRV